MSYRNTKFLDSNRIIYRREPISDHPDEVHDWVQCTITVRISATIYLGLRLRLQRIVL